mmetsp:Transcript_73700/g.116228  ORF Transcript_73700/g.116228 Transcript_73700/m.116228 type:complete len:105 (+) Transcript_73700:53-367(+)
MFFLSHVLLRSKSKRLAVHLVSSAQTGFSYWSEKSPLKRDVRLALRKHDPIVNRHVMFYEAAIPKQPPKRLKRPRPISWARWTGIGIQELVKATEKKHMRKGHF